MGRSFFNAGQYFEAHEAWEDLWRQTEPGPLKSFYQGMIQAAVGLHHLVRGNRTGARSQLTKALDKLGRAPAEVHGTDVADLVERLTQARDRMQVEPIRIRSRLW